MTVITTRITVSPDGTIFGRAPSEVPPGEHPVAITIATVPAGKPFTMKNFPVHELGWEDSLSLRREDMYGDDGR
jgi:hypothetical protein